MSKVAGATGTVQGSARRRAGERRGEEKRGSVSGSPNIKVIPVCPAVHTPNDGCRMALWMKRPRRGTKLDPSFHSNAHKAR